MPVDCDCVRFDDVCECQLVTVLEEMLWFDVREISELSAAGAGLATFTSIDTECEKLELESQLSAGALGSLLRTRLNQKKKKKGNQH